jgi:Tfp pilus assembly protein PilO
MSPTDTTERRSNLKSSLLERLHDPVQLRIGVMVGVFLLGYVAIYTPLNDQIAATTKKLERDKQRLEIAKNLESLQKQFRVFEDRVPQQADSKEWMQCLVEGTRQFPIKLTKIDCRDTRLVGPYKAITMQMDLEGTFADLDRFLGWLETNKRLLRADDLRLSPRDNKTMVMSLTVLGLTG